MKGWGTCKGKEMNTDLYWHEWGGEWVIERSRLLNVTTKRVWWVQLLFYTEIYLLKVEVK